MAKSTNIKHRHPARAMLGRDLRLFAREVPAALAIAVLLGLFCVLAASALFRGTQSGYTAASVAVVDADNSFTSSIAISMVAKQDFAAPLAITKTTAEKAEQGLEDGSFMAVLYLPSGYADGILSGTVSSARLVVSNAVPLQSDVVRLLCSFGEELLCTGQYGVFAGERLVAETAPERISSYLQKSNAKFLARSLAGPGIVREQVPYALTGVGTGEWYGILYAMTFFQLLCLACQSLGRDCRTELLRRLAADGIGNGAFLAGKWAILTALYALLAAGLLLFGKLAAYPAGVPALLLALAMSASVGLALMLCLNGGCVIAVTALTAAGLFASGGIVPRMELPLIVNTVGDLLPLGAAARLSASLLSGRVSLPHAAACLVWTALAWCAMWLRLNALRKGAER